jgi:hypothetical protein
MMPTETIDQSSLFIDLNSEEAASLSGGGRRHRPMHGGNNHGTSGYFDLQGYIFGLGAGVLFGNPGLTPDEVQVVWERALSI